VDEPEWNVSLRDLQLLVTSSEFQTAQVVMLLLYIVKVKKQHQKLSPVVIMSPLIVLLILLWMEKVYSNGLELQVG
jgi:hypothetical protein